MKKNPEHEGILQRTRRTHATYRNAVRRLEGYLYEPFWKSNPYLRANIAREALSDFLSVAPEFVKYLDALGEDEEYYLDFLRAEANDLARTIRNRQLALKMQNTSGRTEEEKEIFRAKLAELEQL